MLITRIYIVFGTYLFMVENPISIAQQARYLAEIEVARRQWATNCPGVDEMMGSLATKLHGEYPSGQEFPNAKALTWSEGSIGYSISLMLHDSRARGSTTLRVHSAAWVDDETKLVRRSIGPYSVDLATPVRAGVLEGTVDGLMADLVNNSPALTRPAADLGIKVTETVLASNPG